MDTSTMIIVAVVLAVLIIGSYFFFYQRDKKAMQAEKDKTKENAKEALPGQALQLQAYERLVILAERIALPNLVSRLNQPDLDKVAMQVLLTNTIKQEFEYNLSQQIYVSKEAWDAIRNLKEQNIHIVNQVALILPVTATAADLNKSIIDVIMSQPNGSMHTLVQEALSYEARKLMV